MQMLWQEAESANSVARLTNAAEVQELVAVFAAIASEQGWEPGDALAKYTQRSVYFALRGGAWGTQLLGGMQLLLPDESGALPCHALWPTAPLYASRREKPRCAHIAMLGLLAEARGDRLHFWHLGIEMWRYCVATGITTLFIEVTPRVLPLYQYLGWPLTICGESRLHWGEECYLCTMELPDVAQVLLRRAQNSRHYHRIIAQAFRLESSPHTLASN